MLFYRGPIDETRGRSIEAQTIRCGWKKGGIPRGCHWLNSVRRLKTINLRRTLSLAFVFVPLLLLADGKPWLLVLTDIGQDKDD